MLTQSLLAVVGAVAMAVVGCGGDNSSSSTTTAVVTTAAATTAATTAAATTTTAARTTTSAAATTVATTAVRTTTTNPNSVESVTEKATQALLTAAEVGPGFVTDAYTPDAPSDPTPCGTPSAAATVPPAVHVGTVIAQPDTQQLLQEQIMVYTDATEAGEAFQAGSAGLACPSGTVHFDDGTSDTLDISGPVDVTSDVGGDQASVWQVQATDIQGVLVAVRLKAALVVFQFVAPAAASNLEPAPLDVVKAGVEKVVST
jgi:hypothetical protein